MITLCGFAVSNYYNKVKLVLLEKGVAFDEELVHPRTLGAEMLAATPLGKVPFIRVEGQTLCESQVIVDYVEARYPQPPLLPADPLAAAKVRELVTFTELHLELVARELYGQAFFGGTLSEASQERVRKQLTKNIAAFKRLAKFSPYLAGEQFSLADCSAWVTLPLVALASKAVLGEDLLQAADMDWKRYAKLVGERPSAQKVTADKAAYLAAQAAKT
jgi:glutathione S-transferase